MKLIGRINRKKIYYIQIRNNPNWKSDLPKNDWIAFTIANEEDEELIPPIVQICIDKNVSYTSSTGEFASGTENYFDEEIEWRKVDCEIQNKEKFDNKNLITTISDENFEDAFWFASTLIHDDNSVLDKIVCIDFTKRKIKNHLIKLIEKINADFVPNEEINEWTPISLVELQELIKLGIRKMTNNQLTIWNKIKVDPEKWQEEEYGKEGRGFWIVAINANEVIWYNDIEEGFNISTYSFKGKIDNYYTEQDELQWIINKLK